MAPHGNGWIAQPWGIAAPELPAQGTRGAGRDQAPRTILWYRDRTIDKTALLYGLCPEISRAINITILDQLLISVVLAYLA